jgi:lipoprotein-anchoring transpeptidase ErfK/SrfK
VPASIIGGRALAAALAACSNDRAAPADAANDALAATDAALDAGARADADAGRDKGEAGVLGAASFQTSVVNVPAWPESGTGAIRLGYLRHGGRVTAYARPIVNDDCPEGWYELTTGGFVCGKSATFDLTDPRVKLAPRQPDRDAGMPYKYGYNLSDGTPLYRRVLSAEDRKQYEPWLVPQKPAPDDDGAKGADADKDDGADEERRPAKHGPSDAGADARTDAGKPKLKELKGRGVLVRKMVRGFYLALDRDFKAAGAHWWRTTFGFAVPFDRIALQTGVTKHTGSWFTGSALATLLDAGADDAGAVAPGTVAFITSSYAQKIELDADLKKASAGAPLSKRDAVLLVGRSAVVSGVTYVQTGEGWWLRPGDVKTAHPSPPGDLAPGEKWIDVDLTRQALVAFEGERPVFATLISSGRRNPQDKERDFPTPTGIFRVREKHVTATMDGDVASDGPYSIEDVPWVMYFQGSYALHGAFWHDAFGYPRSHGCVNLAPEDARTLFAWADPPLPDGWHGVFAPERAGTRIVIHEDPPEKHARK